MILSKHVSRANPLLWATVRGSKTALRELPHSSRAITAGSKGHASIQHHATSGQNTNEGVIDVRVCSNNGRVRKYSVYLKLGSLCNGSISFMMLQLDWFKLTVLR